MDYIKYVLYFTIGGIVTTTIIALEESGLPLLSRLATLFPVFTWLSYLFLGQTESTQQITDHAKFVLTGTIVSWIPYMLAIIILTPKIGTTKAIIASIIIFTIIALTFSYFYPKLNI
jgi:uncharacterized membrane protein (GlpM family)